MKNAAISNENVKQNQTNILVSIDITYPIIAGNIELPRHAPNEKHETILPSSGNCDSINANSDPHVEDKPMPMNAHENQKTGSLVCIAAKIIVAMIELHRLTIRIPREPISPEIMTATNLKQVNNDQ